MLTIWCPVFTCVKRLFWVKLCRHLVTIQYSNRCAAGHRPSDIFTISSVLKSSGVTATHVFGIQTAIVENLSPHLTRLFVLFVYVGSRLLAHDALNEPEPLGNVRGAAVQPLSSQIALMRSKDKYKHRKKLKKYKNHDQSWVLVIC